MAWFAELKRRHWYCIVGLNMRGTYRKKLYDDWYNSLTDEMKHNMEMRKKREAEAREREIEGFFDRLRTISKCIGSIYERTGTCLKYGDFLNLYK